MGDLKDKILQVYQKIENQLDDKQDKLTQQQLAGLNSVPSKANASDLRYSLYQPSPQVLNALMTVNVSDRAVNLIQIPSTVNSVTIVFPNAQNNKARDFFIRFEVASGVSSLSLIFSNEDNTAPVLENTDGDLPDVEGNSTAIMYFSETKANTYLVKCETVVQIS